MQYPALHISTDLAKSTKEKTVFFTASYQKISEYYQFLHNNDLTENSLPFLRSVVQTAEWSNTGIVPSTSRIVATSDDRPLGTNSTLEKSDKFRLASVAVADASSIYVGSMFQRNLAICTQKELIPAKQSKTLVTVSA